MGVGDTDCVGVGTFFLMGWFSLVSGRRRRVTLSSLQASGYEFKHWFGFAWTATPWQRRLRQPESNSPMKMQGLATGGQDVRHMGRLATASDTVVI